MAYSRCVGLVCWFISSNANTMANEMKHIEQGQTWKHHKGGLYKILAIANNANDDGVIVVYKSLENGNLIWWHYIGEFIATTDEGKDRFTLVEG